MTVYVNDTPWNNHGTPAYHLWADEPDELAFMAAALGTTAFQFSPGPFKHYYVSAGQRDLALAIGVQPTDRWGPLEWTATMTLRGSLDPERWEWAHKMLAFVGARRAGQ